MNCKYLRTTCLINLNQSGSLHYCYYTFETLKLTQFEVSILKLYFKFIVAYNKQDVHC